MTPSTCNLAYPSRISAFKRIFTLAGAVLTLSFASASVAQATDTPDPAAYQVAGLAGNDTDILTLVREYDDWRQDLVAIAQGSVSSAGVKRAHQRLAARDHKTMAKAWIAWQAAVASRTPAFNKEIRKKTKRSSAKFLANLDAAPHRALTLKSSGKAAQAIIRNINAETAHVAEMGASFHKAAMDMQRKKPARLAVNKTTMSRFLNPDAKDNIILAGANVSLPGNSGNDKKSRDMLGQMLTLAAHMSANEAKGQSYSASTTALLVNKKGEQCLKWAKLNLAQCLAASRNTSEEAYCTGRHALSDVSACWSYMATPTGMAS